MSIIMQSNGAMSVCLQTLPVRESTSCQTSPRHRTLEYWVYMVHRGSMLRCVVESVPASVAEQGRLCFSTHGEYIFASLPERLVHLICVSPEYYPCNHLLLQDFSSGNLIPEKFSLPFTSSSGVSVLFDVNAGGAVRPVLDAKWLLQYFRYGNNTARLAAINYAAVQKRDTSLARQLFDVLKEDPWSPSVQQVLAEYLIGSTYVSFKRHIADKHTMYQIPFTTQEPSATVRLQSGGGEVNARITYSSVPTPDSLVWSAKSFMRTLSSRRSPSDARGHEAALMKLLLKDRSNQRFSTSMVAKLHQSVVQASNEDMTRLTERRTSEHTILSKITAKARSFVSGSSSPTSPVHVELCPVEALMDSHTVLSDSLLQQMQHSLSQHLSVHLKADSRIKVLQLAAEYCTCMTQQAKNLWNMLISSVYGDSTVIEYNLACSASVAEQRLFYLLERFWFALDKYGFPRPRALPYTMAVFGFKTLDFNMFLEYVDNDVITPSAYFVKQLIKELPDSEWGINCKEALLNRLQESEAAACRSTWHEANSRQQKVRSSLSQVLSEASSTSTGLGPLGRPSITGRIRSDSHASTTSQVKTSELPPYIASLIEHVRVSGISLKSGAEISEEMVVDAARAHASPFRRNV